jgi:type IV secretory pathway VirB3-like protein
MKLLPITGMGKWSAGLSVAFLVLTGMRLGGLFVPVPSMILAAMGLVGFFLGLYAIIKKKDRAMLTALSVLAGCLIIFMISAELIYPH